ncbi:MAG: Na/Pi cotransporter family protein [Halanaerobiaceae bacterium]
MLFFAGLFLFLLGIEGSKRSLNKFSEALVGNILLMLDKSFFLSIIAGVFVTCIIQSSSAVTIILIAMLNAGLIKYKPALGIMMGANIGTTVTVQIISFPVFKIYPFLLLMGIIIIFLGRKRKNIFLVGTVIFCFAVIFAGLDQMTNYFQQGKINLLKALLLKAENGRLAGILLGLVLTALIQSSSLITGITVSMAYSSSITLSTAVAVALGSNIGTCFTGFLAAINTDRISRSLAIGQLIYNIIGVAALLPLYNLFIWFIMYSADTLPRQIANAHTLFNIFNLLIFLPFADNFISWLRRE